jgi:hypothetical protein
MLICSATVLAFADDNEEFASSKPNVQVQTIPTIAPLNKDQPAPFLGVLLSPEAVAKIVADKDVQANATQLTLQHQVDLDKANVDFQLSQLKTTCSTDKSIIQAQLTDSQKQNAILMKQLENVTGGISAPVWIGIGIVGGIVSTLVIGAIVK